MSNWQNPVLFAPDNQGWCSNAGQLSNNETENFATVIAGQIAIERLLSCVLLTTVSLNA